MKIHRFYVPNLGDERNLWFNNPSLVHQWLRVLRFRIGQQLTLFDGRERDYLFSIVDIASDNVRLQLVKKNKLLVPKKDIYLLWSLLKKDKNEWVLQKCTEIGINHFVPIITNRTEKTGLDSDRAHRIIIEAAEQCGRSNVPTIHHPIGLLEAINQYAGHIKLYACEQGSNPTIPSSGSYGIIIGPEGGWTEIEKLIFNSNKIEYMSVNDLTLRAETASIVASSKLLQ